MIQLKSRMFRRLVLLETVVYQFLLFFRMEGQERKLYGGITGYRKREGEDWGSV